MPSSFAVIDGPSLPGVPGPGLLVIFVGVRLLDFPGKRRLERKLFARPAC